MAKQSNPTNIAGARRVASVAKTDHSVPYKSPHPEQARKDSIQSGVHNRQMAHLNEMAEAGCKH
jgi:phosphoribosylformylglycinamidine (FGAM) synthase-like amidotransferase family enzyme